MADQSPLFNTYKLPCGQVLSNRIVKAAMTEGLSPDGNPNERLNNLYEQWSSGGAGLLISGNCMIDHRYLERPGNIILDENSDRKKLTEWAESGKRGGNLFFLQISHPGRQCTKWVNSQPVAPSPIKVDILNSFAKPIPLSSSDIVNIIKLYGQSAAIAEECGFDGVQIHAAHGYLISQFLSPLTNQREDEWGGDFNKRLKFLLEVITSVKNAVSSSFAVTLKLNSSDFQKGGYSISDCLKVIQAINDYGLDFVELSGGTYEQPQLLGHHGDKRDADLPQRESTKRREAYFVDYAKQVREVARMPLMVTGGFMNISALETALSHVDLVGLARPFCVIPDWPNQVKEGQMQQLPRPENQLGGKGLLGPTSSIQFVQGVNIQGEVAWFYYQIIRLSDKKSINWKKSLLGAFLFHVFREQVLAHNRRKHLKQ